MKKFFALFFLVPLLAFASAQTPAEYIKTSTDTVVAILSDSPKNTADLDDAQIARLAAVVDDFFDPRELARRALGQYWRLFSQAEQTEFENLFLKLIKQVYLKKSIHYNDERVNVDQEILKSDTLAEVLTTIIGPNTRTQVNYYLKKIGPSWKVYDVVVENVSFVKNYRSQFQGILQNNSPDHLISILREKVHE